MTAGIRSERLLPERRSPALLSITIGVSRTTIPQVRRLMVAFAATQGASTATQSDIALAVSEALTNALVHGYGGRAGGLVHVAADVEDGALEVAVADDGRGLRVGSISDGLGLGLALVAKTAARFALRDREPHGTEVWMRFHLDA